MATDNNKLFRLYNDQFNADGMTDENALTNALLTQPDVLSPVITHLMGREDKRFPLSFLTEGFGNVKYINDVEYDYPVMGRMNKSVKCIALVQGTGVAHSRFKVEFAEKWFVRQYIIEFPTGIQMRIMEDPYEGTNGGWVYTCQLITTNAQDAISSTDVVGENAIQLFAPSAMSGSRGNESNWVAPSKMRNQISLVRKSYRYEGNATNKVVQFQLPLASGTTNLWYPFEEYQHQLRWREEVESILWYSKFNKDANGVIHLKDDNGKPIPLGAGVLEQIPNYDTYSILTAQKLKTVVRDALYGATDASETNIVLFTGLGGLEEFDRAMKDELANGTYIKNTDPNSFVRGGSESLQFGGFFTSYKHIDGHNITVRQLPMFDHGARAMNSRRHPVTGLPLESYRMIFLDMSTYDGQQNVTMVTRKGRELVRWAVAGASVPPGFSGNSLRANDIDGASVHFMKECGINIRRATNCLHLECNIS